MQQLLNIINAIATTNFQSVYIFLNHHPNRQTHLENYIDYLKEWNLYSEIFLLENDKKILSAIKDNSRLTKIYNQNVLKEGDYNYNRYWELKKILD
jgi:hypothetical protein